MITRRRGRNNMDVQTPCSPVEVGNVSDMTEDVNTSPLDGLATDHVDASELELEDLFGIDELSWTFEGDAVSPLFDIGLAELGVGDTSNGDSGIGGSMSPSPERGRASQKRKLRDDPASLTNKNAIAARINRLKKKEYVTGLEKSVGNLSTENRMLKQENGHLNKRVEELEDETRDPKTMTTTMRCPGNASRWKRKRLPGAFACTLTRTMSLWSSALSVRRVPVHRSKCRVKYFSVFRC